MWVVGVAEVAVKAMNGEWVVEEEKESSGQGRRKWGKKKMNGQGNNREVSLKKKKVGRR